MRFRAGSSVIYPVVLGLTVTSGLIVLSGCGGGSSDPRPGVATPTPTGGGTPTPTPTPTPAAPVLVKTRILWAPRSRQIPSGGNAVGGPSSSLSAVITLSQVDGTGDLFTQTVNRPSSPPSTDASAAPLPQDYTSPTTVRPGVYFLRVRFFANADGQGASVGDAAASANVLADGTLSTTVATFGTIQSVDVPQGQIVKIGQTASPVYTAKDAQGNAIAITAGSAFVKLVDSTSTISGQASASVQGDQITGITPSRAKVQVTIDNAVSPATDIIIRSNATIAVTPSPITVSLLAPAQITATVANDPTNSGVTYSIDPTAGSVDANGLFTPTRKEGTYTLTVRSKYDPDITTTVPVTIQSLVGVAITSTPANPNPLSIKGDTAKFSATLTNVPAGQDGGVTWSVLESGGGSITADGTYTSPVAPGDYTVVATSNFDSRKTASFVVQVRSLATVAITTAPGGPLDIGATFKFAATVSGKLPASNQDRTVTWSVQGTNSGTIAADGTYTAPLTPGTYTVVAASNFDPTKTATFAVQVANRVAVDIQPNSDAAPLTISINAQRQFTASVAGVPANRPATDREVTWAAPQGGTIITTPNANIIRFSPPADTQGNFRVVATSKFDPTKSKTVNIQVRSGSLPITVQ